MRPEKVTLNECEVTELGKGEKGTLNQWVTELGKGEKVTLNVWEKRENEGSEW